MVGGIGRFLRGIPARLLPAGLPPMTRDPLPDGPLPGPDQVVFDLEATGLRPSRGDALVQIGAVRLRGTAEVASLVLLANPGRTIPPASIRYHGITDAMVRDAPPVAEAVALFRDFAAGAVLVAHNAGYDTMLLRAAEGAGAPPIRNPVLCSLALSRWLDPAEPDHSLDGLCGRNGIVIEGRHQALGDARATAALWLHLLNRAGMRGVRSLAELGEAIGMAAALDRAALHF